MIETNAKQAGQNLKELGKTFIEHSNKTIKEKEKILGEFARKVKSSIIYSMENDPKTGHLYKIGGKFHQASAPGESPAVLSGALRNSLDFTLRKNEVEIGAKNNIEYPKFLEQGTSKMLPRPYLMVNTNKHMNDIKLQLLRRIAEIKIYKSAGWYT